MRYISRRILAGFTLLLGFLPGILDEAAIASGGTGTLKICTKPQTCTVRVAGYVIEKKGTALTLENLPAGSYQVVCSSAAGNFPRYATVATGRTTVVFISLTGVPAPASAASAAEPEPVVGAAAIPPIAPVAGAYSSRPQSSFDPSTTAPALSRNYMMDIENAFELAQMARSGINPFTARTRLSRALLLYRHVIEDFPRNPRTELAHYYCGRIFESRPFRDETRALTEYRTVLALNPLSQTDAAERIDNINYRLDVQAGLIAEGEQNEPVPVSVPSAQKQKTEAEKKQTTAADGSPVLTLERKPDNRPVYMQILP